LPLSSKERPQADEVRKRLVASGYGG